jgi:hypothetical protein
VGAEGIAAAQFARCGFDVLVQAGRDKPWYDLVVTKGGNLLRVSVKASEDGRWALTQPFLRSSGHQKISKADCHAAIDLWVGNHGSRTVCCLVQFFGTSIDQLPRIYLAAPAEIAHTLRATADRLTHPDLYEQYEWRGPEGQSNAEALPSSWLFSAERIQELLAQHAPALFPSPALGKSQAEVRSRSVASSIPVRVPEPAFSS